jgi:hypothetical protein
LLVVYCVVRTLFFARFVETPEPRYVLECFPAVIALGAQVFALRLRTDAASASKSSSSSACNDLALRRAPRQLSSTGSG